MSNQQKSIWVVYNGEIYNYLELREELKGLGHSFRTNTDTEVLLTAYEEWQDECLTRFNGMWSFVVYDRTRNVLFGARDRFGVKPIYYYFDNRHFVFASEIKAFINLPFVRREINPKAVYDYLIFGLNENEEEGFFKNIFELPPSYAFYYDLSQNTIRKWEYYSLSYTDHWEKFDRIRLAQYRVNVQQLISKAISIRLRSDVPIGTCLSGGVDSSTIVCFINRILETGKFDQIGENQKVFTASYDGQAIDESKWARIVVDRTKTLWYQTFPKPNEFIEDLEDLVYTQDIPFYSTSIYSQYRVMRLARENGIKVLLDGQGGDELFGGYLTYYGAFFAEMFKNFAIGEIIRELKSLKNSPTSAILLFSTLGKMIVKKLSPNPLMEFFLKWGKKENHYLNADFFRQHSYRLLMMRDMVTTSLNEMLHQHISKMSLKPLLRYEDRNSMRFSIEARTPFSDDVDLIEDVFKIPPAYKIYCGWSKYLLRAATAGVLPEEIRLRRDKIGFATPEYYWLNQARDRLKVYFTSDLSDFLNVTKIRKDWDTLVRNQPSNQVTGLWRFINFAVWNKVYIS
jgi:asparagine synthase (glutamine-hydrolysing)